MELKERDLSPVVMKMDFPRSTGSPGPFYRPFMSNTAAADEYREAGFPVFSLPPLVGALNFPGFWTTSYELYQADHAVRTQR